jgi:hypothetical protein
MSYLGGYELNNYCKGEFLAVLLNSFFILLYYSYETRLQIFVKLRPAVMEIFYIWEGMS